MALQQIANTDISSTGTFALGSISSSTLTSGRVTYATTGGLLTDSSSLTFNGSTLTASSLSGGNITNTNLTSGRITYATTGGLLTDSSSLVFTGSNLGIGATSPSYKLSIKGNSATSNNILLTHDTDTTGAYSRIRFQFAEGNTSIASEIRNIQRVNGQNGASLGLYTDSTAGTLTQRMLIDYDGNVGIGTTNPDYGSYGATERILGITGVATNRGRLSLQNTSTGTTGVAGTLAFFNGSTLLASLDINADGATNKGLYAFNTNNGTSVSERMRITNTGLVGIGTTDPKANLQVTSSAFPVLKVADGIGGGAIALGDSTISDNYVGIWRGAANSISGGGYLNIQGNNIAFMSTDAVFGSATRTMTLNSSGFLGIGQTSPICLIDVYGGGAYTYARFYRNDEAGYGGRVGTGNTLHSLGAVRSLGLDGFSQISFGIAGVQVAQFDSSGNLGIGTTSQNERLRLNSSTAGQARMSISYADSTISFYGSYSGIVGSGNATDTMLSSQAVLAFGAGGTTERMRIRSDGAVNIGVTNADTYNGNLTVAGSVGTGQGITNTTAQISVYETTSGSASGLWFGAMTNETTGVIGSRTATGNIAFQTYNGTWQERMRLDYNGRLCINSTSVNNAGYLSIDFYGQSTQGITLDDTYSANGGAYILFRNYLGNTAGYISHDGTATVAYVTSSDYRLKENISPMTGALAIIAQLKPVTYTWKEDGSDGQGFIAHELAEVVPNAVSGEKDALYSDGSIKPQGTDTSFLVATLTAAIQEQQALIESMATKLKDAGVAGF